MTVLSNMLGSSGRAGEVPQQAPRRSFAAAYKLRILAEDEAADAGRRGVVLRREGLYSSHLVEWRRSRDAGALAGLSATRDRPPADPVERDNARLREANAHQELDLSYAREVIAIQGKLSALLDDLSKRAHDASTPPRSGPSSPPRSSG